MLKKAGIFFPGYTNKAPLGICEEEEKRKEEAGGAVQAAQCYCGVFTGVSSDSTAIVGACLVAYAMRVLSTKLKSILYLGGLHCPCDYDSFTASL